MVRTGKSIVLQGSFCHFSENISQLGLILQSVLQKKKKKKYSAAFGCQIDNPVIHPYS